LSIIHLSKVGIRNNSASFPEALLNERAKIKHLKITHIPYLLTSFFVSGKTHPLLPESPKVKLRGSEMAF
jgi:hypothetical protein